MNDICSYFFLNSVPKWDRHLYLFQRCSIRFTFQCPPSTLLQSLRVSSFPKKLVWVILVLKWAPEYLPFSNFCLQCPPRTFLQRLRVSSFPKKCILMIPPYPRPTDIKILPQGIPLRISIVQPSPSWTMEFSLDCQG